MKPHYQTLQTISPDKLFMLSHARTIVEVRKLYDFAVKFLFFSLLKSSDLYFAGNMAS